MKPHSYYFVSTQKCRCSENPPKPRRMVILDTYVERAERHFWTSQIRNGSNFTTKKSFGRLSAGSMPQANWACAKRMHALARRPCPAHVSRTYAHADTGPARRYSRNAVSAALRGTQLLKAILQHEVWETEEWKRDLPELSI